MHLRRCRLRVRELTLDNLRTHLFWKRKVLTPVTSLDPDLEYVSLRSFQCGKFLKLSQPYVAEHSRSIYARLGARIAFFGIDARTEVSDQFPGIGPGQLTCTKRTRKQVNYPETYEIIFTRLRKELTAAKASSSPVRHLVVLLGIPIAYPVGCELQACMQ